MSKIIYNPYKPVWVKDWSVQQKCSLHSHTSMLQIGNKIFGSDGQVSAEDMIALLEAKGYDICCFTDHDSPSGVSNYAVCTIMPEDLGIETSILFFPARELTSGPDRQCWFIDYIGSPDVDRDWENIRKAGGLSIINHPGGNSVEEGYTDEWYAEKFIKFRDILVGIECYNSGDRYPNDRKLWDRINAMTIPYGKVVFGYSNSDAHVEDTVYKNYMMFLCDKNIPSLKFAMQKGCSYFCYEPGNTGNDLTPRINNIEVDDEGSNFSITISHTGGDVKWITNGTTEVGTGDTFNFTELVETNDFIRAEIHNEHGVTGTQPIAFIPIEGFKRQPSLYKNNIKKIYYKAGVNAEIEEDIWEECELRTKIGNCWMPFDINNIKI